MPGPGLDWDFDMLTSRFPHLLRVGARRVDGSDEYRTDGEIRRRSRNQAQESGWYSGVGWTPISIAVTGASERLRIVRVAGGSIEAKVPAGAGWSSPSILRIASPSRIP